LFCFNVLFKFFFQQDNTKPTIAPIGSARLTNGPSAIVMPAAVATAATAPVITQNNNNVRICLFLFVYILIVIIIIIIICRHHQQ
jgi:hypothetical protein